jgi:hypothetical protein
MITGPIEEIGDVMDGMLEEHLGKKIKIIK